MWLACCPQQHAACVAQALAALATCASAWLHKTAVPALLARAMSTTLDERHGAVLGLGELLAVAQTGGMQFSAVQMVRATAWCSVAERVQPRQL